MQNGLILTIRANGKLADTVSVPCGNPKAVMNVCKQAVGALHYATQHGRAMFMGTAPMWKIWIIKHVLRAL